MPIQLNWDACASHRHSELVQANPPGSGTSALQEDWPCLMDNGVGTHTPT